MGIPDHLTCLLWNVYTGQEATGRPSHGTTDWFQSGKGICQGCILLGEISITSDMQIPPPLWQKMKRNQRFSWWKFTFIRGEWKSSLKIQHSKKQRSWHLVPSLHSIQFHHFMAYRWGNSGNSDRLYFLVDGVQNQWMVTAAMKLKHTCFFEEKQWQT